MCRRFALLTAYDLECKRTIDVGHMGKTVYRINDAGRPDQVARRAGARLYRDLGITDSVVAIQDITVSDYSKPMRVYRYTTSLESTPPWDALPEGMNFKGEHRVIAKRAR